MRILRQISLIVLTALLLSGCGNRRTRLAIEEQLHQHDTTEAHVHEHNHDHTNTTKQGITISAERLSSGNAIDTIYMGRVGAGEVVTRKLALRNADEQHLVLQSSRTTCGCVAVEFSTEPIQSKRSRDIEVRFDSAGYSGHFSQSLYLQTSLSDTPLHLVVTANVR